MAEGLRLDALELRLGDFALSAELALDSGARAAVIGPSGAGKSTLLGAIAGFVPPVSGRVLWQGRDITDLAPGDRPLTMLFQDVNLFPHLTVTQNVGLGLSPGLRLIAADRQRVEAALEEVGLAGMGARRPRELSGGQQSRVALARALLRARPLLLLDEPFSALGPALRREMLGLVGTVLDRTGATLLMVTHDPEDARELTPEMVVVAGGRAWPPRGTVGVLDDPPEELRGYLG